MSVACLLAGVLTDIDHVFDYSLNSELRSRFRYLLHPREFLDFLSREHAKHEPTCSIYKPLHSIELLVPALFLYVFGVWNAVATGIFIGFMIHLIMDILPVGHIGAMSMIYKMSKGFPDGASIVKQRLSRTGRDVDKCQLCGALGETVLHRGRRWYVGFTERGLGKAVVLCEDCRDRKRSE